MRLEDFHPFVIAIYFVAVAGIVAACAAPFPVIAAFLGGLSYFLCKNGLKEPKTHIITALLFVFTAFLNPIFSHRGETVLFVVNDRPITWEATVAGLLTAGMLVAVLYLFRAFSRVMTSEKLFCLFGVFSPKFALVFSMALRYVPLFGKKWRQVRRTQRALGAYREENVVDRLRGEWRVFSVMLTWALENGIVTADSMEARGYGTGRRTQYTPFRFRARDGALLALILALAAVPVFAMIRGALAVTLYPAFAVAEKGALTLAAYVAFAALCLLPLILETEESLRWHNLRSKI